MISQFSGVAVLLLFEIVLPLVVYTATHNVALISASRCPALLYFMGLGCFVCVCVSKCTGLTRDHQRIAEPRHESRDAPIGSRPTAHRDS